MAVQGRKVAFIGASGQLGAPTVKALVAQGVHTITAIQRQESTGSFPAEVIVKKGDLEDETFLADVLKGQDVLVLMPPLSKLVELQTTAVRAAAKARVPYIFPSEFGPDPYAQQLIEENGLLQAKRQIRDLIDDLGVSTWISVANGPWLDAGLKNGMWGVDAKARKATLWGGANGKANTATVAHTAQVVAAALSMPEADLSQYKRKAVYAPSWHLTQREILEATQRATGTTNDDWDISTANVRDVAKAYEEGIKQGDGMAPYTKFYVTQFLEGHGGDFQSKISAAELAKLEKLGLQKENLEEAILVTIK